MDDAARRDDHNVCRGRRRRHGGLLGAVEWMAHAGRGVAAGAEDHAKKKTHACRRQAAMLAGAGHVLEVAAVAVAVVVDRPVADPHVGGNNC